MILYPKNWTCTSKYSHQTAHSHFQINPNEMYQSITGILCRLQPRKLIGRFSFNHCPFSNNGHTVDGCKVLHHLGWNSFNNGINMEKHLSTGAGFLPSTVQYIHVSHGDHIFQNALFSQPLYHVVHFSRANRSFGDGIMCTLPWRIRKYGRLMRT